MRALLYIYLKNEHGLEGHVARAISHAFNCIAYFTPVFGAVAADSYFGKYKVILVVSIVYVLGHALLSMGAWPALGSGVRQTLDYLGLLTIALGTGGIKPCVSAFGADQIPADAEELRGSYFSYFYMAINTGALFSTFLTPQLRDMRCAGGKTCYPVAFGVPGVLMFIALVLFICGSAWYVKRRPLGRNIFKEIFGCIWLGAKRRLSGTPPEPKSPDDDGDASKSQSKSQKSQVSRRGKSGVSESKHSKAELPKPAKAVKPEQPDEFNRRYRWLDCAAPEYSPTQIVAVKSTLAVVVVLWPLIFFWFLYDQQGTTWVEQATHMNGRMFGKIWISAETMQVINPILIVTLIPICRYGLYPALEKCVHLTELRKLGTGMLMAAVSFFVAGFLQIKIDADLGLPPANHAYVRSLNHNEIPLNSINGTGQYLLHENFLAVPFGEYTSSGGPDRYALQQKTYTDEGAVDSVAAMFHFDEAEKPEGDDDNVVSNWELKNGATFLFTHRIWDEVEWNVRVGDGCKSDAPEKCKTVTLENGAAAVYVLWVPASGEPQLVQVIEPYQTHVLFQLPQLFIISLGEIFLSITGLEFAYSQSHPLMKSVMQAVWTLTVSFGNLTEMILSMVNPMKGMPMVEMFVYGGIIVVVWLIYALQACCYVYVGGFPDDDDEEPISPTKDSQASKYDDTLCYSLNPCLQGCDDKNLRQTTDNVIWSVPHLEARNSANPGLYPGATITTGRAERNGIGKRKKLKKPPLNTLNK
ncbi:unnamed protein product, partial [Mesorhabditis spiculigera]